MVDYDRQQLEPLGCGLSVGVSAMRLLDVFSGAGGAAKGYFDAGFVPVGIDIAPQKHYPFEFCQMDALEALRRLKVGWCIETIEGVRYYLKDFAAIHASPPCEEYSLARRNAKAPSRFGDLIPPTRKYLQNIGLHWIMENVPNAPLKAGLLLCGTHFGLPFIKHRLFEANWPLPLSPATCEHKTARRSEHRIVDTFGTGNGIQISGEAAGILLGVPWTKTRAERRSAIPPAYTQYIGAQLVKHLEWVQ